MYTEFQELFYRTGREIRFDPTYNLVNCTAGNQHPFLDMLGLFDGFVFSVTTHRSQLLVNRELYDIFAKSAFELGLGFDVDTTCYYERRNGKFVHVPLRNGAPTWQKKAKLPE